MSFHFSLSSDEEKEYEWQVTSDTASTKDDEGDSKPAAFSLLNNPSSIDVEHDNPWMSNGDREDEEEDEEEEEDDEALIDWEDADEEEEHEECHKAVNTPSKLAADIADDAEALSKTTGPTGVLPLQPVTIKFCDSKQSASASKNSHDSSSKPRTRHVYRNSQLPDTVKSLLRDLHRSHLLSIASYVVHVSKCCCDSNVLAVAHSLLPPPFREEAGSLVQHKVPNQRQLIGFCTWFFDLVNHVEHRRRRIQQENIAAGARAPRAARRRHGSITASRRKRSRMNVSSSHKQQKMSSSFLPSSSNLRFSNVTDMIQYCSYLSNLNDENPQLLENERGTNEPFSSPQEWSGQDKIQLFIAMARSMGWRARYLVSIDPIKQDLDIDHPLLMSTFRNVLHVVSLNVGDIHNKKNGNDQRNEGDKKPKSRKRARVSGKEIEKKIKNCMNNTAASVSTVPASSADSAVNSSMIGWVEILYQDTGKNNAKQQNGNLLRWAHVDPSCELIDKPNLVEIISQAKEENVSWKRTKRRKTIAYALAIEHCPVLHKNKNHFQKKNVATETEREEEDEITFRARLTDVTPRYASRWFESLKKRGSIPPQNSKKAKLKAMQSAGTKNINIQQLEDTWWAETLKSLNQAFRKTARVEDSNRSSSKEDATTLARDPKCALKGGASTLDAILVGDTSDEDEKEGGSPASGVKSCNEKDIGSDSEDDLDRNEKQELRESALTEALPSSKAAYKNHPLYVIPSVLKTGEVLSPDAKSRICGFFKGEPVYRRSDVSDALPAKKWLYHGRKVRDTEISAPVKRRKSRRNPSANTGFKALKSYGVGESNDGSAESQAKQLELASRPLDDGLEDTYAFWQTDSWTPPPVGPHDTIPINEYKNVELELLNPGLVHISEPKIASVAKTLGIPYAPCLVGFEGHGGNRTPTVKGIVVHAHNADILREASVEVVSRSVEKEHEDRRKTIYLRWKRVLVGILTKDRLEREYGDTTEN